MARYSVQLDGAQDYLLHLDVTETSQSIAANTSTVDWTLHVEDVNSWGSFKNDPTPYSINIGGTVYAGNLPTFPPGSFTIRSGTTTLTHNPDGTLTAAVSGYWDSQHSNVGQGTASGNFALTRIPRGPRVKHEGTWRRTISYVKHDGVWKIAIPYVKDNTWQIGAG